MKILITGITGYLGNNLGLAAIQRGFEVHGLVRQLPSKTDAIPGVNYFKGDITDYESITPAMKGCNIVFHAAGLTQLWNKDRTLFYKVNVNGTKNILESALQHQVTKFVFTSSCAVLGQSYERPISENDIRISPFENDYEISKHCAEELVKEYARLGMNAVIVAPPRIYGPGLDTKGNPINRIIKNIINRGVALVPSNADAIGNYAFIDDVVNGHFLAMMGEAGEKYILGGENISYRKFFATIRDKSPRRLRIVTVPIPIIRFFSWVVYLSHYVFGKHTHVSPAIVNRLLQNRALNISKAVQSLKYGVTPFEEGISRTIQHLQTDRNV